jgi:uncharacterized protein (TIGR02246 family)
MSDAIEVVRALEDRRYEAMVAADAAEMNELFSDQLIYTHSHSGMDTKEAFIDNLTSGRFTYRAVRRLEENYVAYENTVLVSSHVNLDITAGAVERTVNARATIVWVHDGGRWQFAAWQSTPVPS